VPDTPRAAKSREEDRAPYLLLVRARLAVLRQELQDLVDARLLRLPHGRRGRSGHGLAAAASVSRLVRPVLTRRRRSDDRVVTRERRNRQAARATRCDVRSPQSIADPRVDWRAARVSGVLAPRSDGSGVRKRRMSAAETPFLGTPRKRFRSARPRARPVMSDRARASSPVARRAHDAAIAALTLCISAYVLWVLAVRLPLVRCGRPQASRDPEARFPFSRAAATSRHHARADRVRAPTRCPFANRAHIRSLTRALLSATLSRVPNTRAPAKPRRDTVDAFDARRIVRSKGHRRVDLAPRRARAASFRFPLGVGLPRQRPSGRAHAISARERSRGDRLRRAALVAASAAHARRVQKTREHFGRRTRRFRVRFLRGAFFETTGIGAFAV